MKITKELLERYHLGRCSLEEEKAVQNWLEEDGIETDFPASMGDGIQLENRIWNEISENLELEEDVAGRNHQFPYSWMQIAASLLLLTGIGASIWLMNKPIITEKLTVKAPIERQYITIRTAKGEKKIHTLPDGTRVNLNGGSELRHLEEFSPKDSIRAVFLNGEAFFNVTKDAQKPFVVTTKRSLTRVLGTRFNLRTYADEFAEKLIVEEGKVRFSSRNKNSTVILTANERGTLLASGRIRKDGVYASRYLAWKDNKLVFENQSMNSIATELERWYGVNVTITNPAFADNYYTGSFQDKSLGEVLETIRYAVGFHYKIANNKVVIY